MLPTCARPGTKFTYSNVTLNQTPHKFFSVRYFSDAVKVNICEPRIINVWGA